MQLANAIEDWMVAHRAGLSASTQRDVTDIAEAVQSCGYADVACTDVGAPQRLDIIAEADNRSTLNPQAIGQFLALVVDWGLGDDQPQLFGASAAVRPDRPAGKDRNSLPSDSDQWQIDDLAEGTQSSAPGNGSHPADDDPGRGNDRRADEHQLGWTEHLPSVGTGDPTASPVPAAASFLRAIDQSAPNRTSFEQLAKESPSPPAIGVDDASTAHDDGAGPHGGIFSEAAQYSPARAVDWVTVLLFTTAALCLAGMIYLYLSS